MKQQDQGHTQKPEHPPLNDSPPARQDLDLDTRLAEGKNLAYVSEPLVKLHVHCRRRIDSDLDISVRAALLFAKKGEAIIEADPRFGMPLAVILGSSFSPPGVSRQARCVLTEGWMMRSYDYDVLARLAMAHLVARVLMRPTKRVFGGMRALRG